MSTSVTFRITSPAVVGRDAEVALLCGVVERARLGEPGIVLVTGEAGMGKSRLTAELMRRSAGDGTRVLRGDCIELGAGEYPYAPLIAALRGLEGEIAAIVPEPAARAELAVLVPELAGGQPPATGGAGPARLHELVLRALASLADADGGLLLVLEDLHWADSATRDLLLFLSRSLRGVPIAVVGTYRSEELHARPDVRRLLVELARSPLTRRLDLAPLAPDAVLAQLEGILGRPPQPEAAARIVQRSDGNPFFVEELVAGLGGSAPPDELPETLRDVLELRLDGVSQDAFATLALMAAAGRAVSEDVLAAASSLSEDELFAHVRELLGLRLIEHDTAAGRYAFRHALVREVIYGQLLPGRRAALHARLAATLASGDAVPGPEGAAALAHHWRRAGRPAEALTASAAAAGAAAAAYGYAEALEHYTAALAAWDAIGHAPTGFALDRAHLLMGAADAAGRVGRYALALEHVQAALAVLDDGDPVRVAEAYERSAYFHYWDTPAVLRAYDEAERRVPPDAEEPVRARVLSGRALTLLGLHRHAEARADARAAAEFAQRLGATDVEAFARVTLGLATAFLGDVNGGMTELRAGRRLAEASGNVEALAQGRLNEAEALRLGGRLSEALAVTEAGEREAARFGLQDSYGRFLAIQAAQDLFRLGRWDEVERRLTALRERDLGPTGELLRETVAGQLALARGDDQRAAEHLERALALSPDGLPLEFVPDVHGALAELWWMRGDLTQARAHVGAALDRLGDSRDLLNGPILPALGARIEADAAERARVHDSEEEVTAATRAAAAMLGALDRLAGGRAELPPITRGFRCLVEAEVARGEPGPWRAAVSDWEQLEQPALETYARWRLAEALATSGSRTQACSELARAAAAARALGAVALQREIDGLAARIGADLDAPAPAREPEPGHDDLGLTDRELTVLALLVEGQSNREIGERLFISSRTAGVHVSNILRKLGVRNRLEAAGVAHRLRLLRVDTTTGRTNEWRPT